MKLLYCPACGDVFNLQFHLKQCGCGITKGQYTSYVDAVSNGRGISLAIGNGSLDRAILNLKAAEAEGTCEDPRAKGIAHLKECNTSILCWVRSNSGPSNPHSEVNIDL